MEKEHTVRMCLLEVASVDPRLLEHDVFFLGEHAYAVAAVAPVTTETSLSVILLFVFP